MTFTAEHHYRGSAIPVIIRGTTRHDPKKDSAPDWKDSRTAPPVFYRLVAGTRFSRRNFLLVLRLDIKIVILRFVTSDRILSVSIGKPRFQNSSVIQHHWRSQDPEEGWDSLLFGGGILQQRRSHAAHPARILPAQVLRGFRVPDAEAGSARQRGPSGSRQPAPCRSLAAPVPRGRRSGLAAELGCRTSRDVRARHWRGIGLFRPPSLLFNYTIESRLTLTSTIYRHFKF